LELCNVLNVANREKLVADYVQLKSKGHGGYYSRYKRSNQRGKAWINNHSFNPSMNWLKRTLILILTITPWDHIWYQTKVNSERTPRLLQRWICASRMKKVWAILNTLRKETESGRKVKQNKIIWWNK